MGELRPIRLTVNGVVRDGQAEPRKLLVDFLREDLGLTGTHVGCEHGVCGACTILVNGEAARSCLMLAVQANGAEILTIEGLQQGAELHPLQEAFVRRAAVQCGYCTPGMIMTANALLDRNQTPSEWDVRQAISNNLCRCTGYEKPVQAILEAAQSMKEQADGK